MSNATQQSTPDGASLEVLVSVRRDAVRGEVNRRLFGSFVEHLGRGVYGGIYEPEHPTADEHGFRRDVVELVQELGVSTVRYPGGNFVSGYDWRDGVGPLDQRPTRLDLAWHTIEPNAFGTDEFVTWCRVAGVEPMLAVNLGLGEIPAALQLLEYANFPGGTSVSDERVANGHPEPHDVRIWCLGNEMDGPWQLGHLPAAEYADKAARTATAMRMFDPSLELVVAGSANAEMETFATWEREVLTRTFDLVDYISCHIYFYYDGDLAAFLGSSAVMDEFIEQIAATVTHVRAVKRSTRDVKISFDEWNVWNYRAHDALAPTLGWESTPRLLEDVYTAADAVVVGTLLLSLLRHCDVVTAASMAQLVNVIGPIMTDEAGVAWRQTTFHPFADVARTAGHIVLDTRVSGARVAGVGEGADLPAVDCAVTVAGTAGHVFLACRSLEAPARVRVDVSDLDVREVISAHVLHSNDPMAVNSAAAPDAVAPRPLAVGIEGGHLVVDLPPVSWASVQLELATVLKK
jgi:alpha-N-arabinofuranosidase